MTVANELYDGDPIDLVERDLHAGALAAGGSPADAMQMLRLHRFLTVRGHPMGPPRQPDAWAAMLRHDGWRAWLGLPPLACGHDSASGVYPLADIGGSLVNQVWQCDACGFRYRSVANGDGTHRQEPVQ